MEAKARKKRRAGRQMERLKSQMGRIADDDDLTEGAKACSTGTRSRSMVTDRDAHSPRPSKS
jgi:hypothetical protein